MAQKPIILVAGDLGVADVAAWHNQEAERAALRAESARNAARTYRTAGEGRQAAPVAADRQDAVADAAQAESYFHASAAALLERLS